MSAFLDIAGLIDDQDRAGITESVDHVITQIIAHGIGIPAGPPQKMLQAIRGGSAAVLGDGPAILAVQTRDHPGDQQSGMT
jgi:hypothetical protein